MRTFWIVILLITALVLLVANILAETGFFRTVEPTNPAVIKQYDLPGVEDIAISHEDSFLILSSADRKKWRTEKQYVGGLYFLDLKSHDAKPIKLSSSIDLYPHGISLTRMPDGTYLLWVINHFLGKHTIEKYRLVNKVLHHISTYADETLISPNDIYGIAEDHFYFTNDHGDTSGLARLAEDYLGLGKASVVYYDGKNYNTVAENITYANGINGDTSRNLMYIASSRGFAVLVYKVSSEGSLQLIEKIDAQTGVDNIDIDPNGTLWIGCHPNLLTFSAYAAGKKEFSPSEVIRLDYVGQGDYTLESIYRDHGHEVSGASVAIPFQNKLFIGNVMDDHFTAIQYEIP